LKNFVILRYDAVYFKVSCHIHSQDTIISGAKDTKAAKPSKPWLVGMSTTRRHNPVHRNLHLHRCNTLQMSQLTSQRQRTEFFLGS